MTTADLGEIITLARKVLDLTTIIPPTKPIRVDTSQVDEYWLVAPSDAFGVVENPKLLLRTLGDDLEELRASVDGDIDERFLWHELQHLTGLLSFISFELTRQTP